MWLECVVGMGENRNAQNISVGKRREDTSSDTNSKWKDNIKMKTVVNHNSSI
jgi:hypothetical protein